MTSKAAPTVALFPDALGDFSIGLRPISEAAWLQGGEADPAARKDPLFETRRAEVWGEIEGSREGQGEVLALVDAVNGPIAGSERPPLYAAARAVADDLCLMEKRQGQWRLTALSLSAGTFFTARDALGQSLEELHQAVPGFDRRFLTRVIRIFDGLRPGLVLERRNWTVANTDVLFAPRSGPYRARVAEIAPPDAGERLFIRMERQTLRRLPRTGGAVFTIRIWTHSLAALRADPERLAAFASAWRTAAPAFAAYKGFAIYAPLVESFLRAMGE
jgi:hypothetical protein